MPPRFTGIAFGNPQEEAEHRMLAILARHHPANDPPHGNLDEERVDAGSMVADHHALALSTQPGTDPRSCVRHIDMHVRTSPRARRTSARPCNWSTERPATNATPPPPPRHKCDDQNNDQQWIGHAERSPADWGRTRFVHDRADQRPITRPCADWTTRAFLPMMVPFICRHAMALAVAGVPRGRVRRVDRLPSWTSDLRAQHGRGSMNLRERALAGCGE